jgi:amino acid transporter
VAAGVANALIVLCFGEAGTRFLEARGPYAYARTAFGPLVGFGVAWTMWATCVVSQAALADALALYVGRFLGGAANGFFTVSKLAPLLLFLGFGLFHIEPGNFSGMFDISGGDLGSAVLMLMFAFGGYELITNTGERVTLAAPRRAARPAADHRHRVRPVPAGAARAAGTLPGLSASETPLADAAGVFLCPTFGMLIAIGGFL